jgi:hypothetical protein
MRLLCSIAVLGMSICVASVPFGASHAHAQVPRSASHNLVSCPATSFPAIHGFTFTSLQEKNLTCPVAKDVMTHAAKHGRVDGYTCKQAISGRNVSIHCTSHTGDKEAATRYHVA